MLVRALSGDIIDIRRSSYSSDTAYHMAILRMRGIKIKSEQNVVEELQYLIKRQR